ncbi:ras and ef-hand domain-containing protein [Anaeramoeba flamelloides]|uniref:Ras and ef-hand domain-containing protein n=1 Tax=Anaeramoeba flamelloides TaxID=1746091 RepID=A0AAV7Z342_9EUKA|nr:ras and ef-hand domain-containing protein [Anaeramoeba flamelloides]
MSKRSNFDSTVKILIVGNQSVGKTCILIRFSDNEFTYSTVPTIGVDFKEKTHKIDNKLVRIQGWDTAGQERFRTMSNSFYRNAHAVMIVFDITNKDSFKNVPFWVENVKNYSNENVLICLVGNKSDLEEKRKVGKEKINECVEKFNLQYFETSSLNGKGVNEAFLYLTKKAIENDQFEPNEEKISLVTNDPEKKTGCC